MKTRFTCDDVCAMVAELRALLLNDRLVNVYDVEPPPSSTVAPPSLPSILLKFQRAQTFLVVRPGQCFYADRAPVGKRRPYPSSFCAKLRKHLRNRRLRQMRQVDDRAVWLIFGDTADLRHSIVLEFFARGNIVLLNDAHRALMLLRTHRYDADTCVRVGIAYPFHALRMPVDEEKSFAARAREPEVETPVQHFAPAAIEMKEGKRQQCAAMIARLDYERVPFDSFSSAVAAFVAPVWRADEGGGGTGDATALACTFAGPKTKTLAAREDAIRRHNRNAVADLQRQMNAIREELAFLETQPREADDARQQALSRGDARRATRDEEHTVVLRLGDDGRQVVVLAHGSIGKSVQMKYRRLKALAVRRRTVEAGLERALAQVRSRHSAPATASQLRCAKRATTRPRVALRHDRWYHAYHWFWTLGGHLVVGGRSCEQNETLVKRHMEDHDLFFHSMYAGGAVCILKMPPPEADDVVTRVTAFDLEETGAFCICHSKSWSEGAPDHAFYVHGRQVSKSAPAGEFVRSGSFIVQGKRRFVKNVRLELGALLWSDHLTHGCGGNDAGFADEPRETMLMVAPYRTSVRLRQSTADCPNLRRHVKILPGRGKRGRTLGHIMDTLQIDRDSYVTVDVTVRSGIRVS